MYMYVNTAYMKMYCFHYHPGHSYMYNVFIAFAVNIASTAAEATVRAYYYGIMGTFF